MPKPGPKKCKKLPSTATKVELGEAHKMKMATKARRREIEYLEHLKQKELHP